MIDVVLTQEKSKDFNCGRFVPWGVTMPDGSTRTYRIMTAPVVWQPLDYSRKFPRVFPEFGDFAHFARVDWMNAARLAAMLRLEMISEEMLASIRKWGTRLEVPAAARTSLQGLAQSSGAYADRFDQALARGAVASGTSTYSPASPIWGPWPEWTINGPTGPNVGQMVRFCYPER